MFEGFGKKANGVASGLLGFYDSPFFAAPIPASGPATDGRAGHGIYICFNMRFHPIGQEARVKDITYLAMPG